MIKEKTTYYSTVTGKEYESLVEAIIADSSAEKTEDSIDDILFKFRAAKDAYDKEIRNVENECDKEFSEKIADIHKKYDDILNQLAESFAKQNGVPEEDVQTSEDNEETPAPAKKKHHVKVVKVRVGKRNSDIIDHLIRQILL